MLGLGLGIGLGLGVRPSGLGLGNEKWRNGKRRSGPSPIILWP